MKQELKPTRLGLHKEWKRVETFEFSGKEKSFENRAHVLN